MDGWDSRHGLLEVFRSLPLTLLASVVQLVECLNESVLGFELKVLPVKPEGGKSSLNLAPFL